MRTKNNDHDVQFLKYGVQWTDRQTDGSDTVEVGAPPKNDQFSIFNRKIKKKLWTDKNDKRMNRLFCSKCKFWEYSCWKRVKKAISINMG